MVQWCSHFLCVFRGLVNLYIAITCYYFDISDISISCIGGLDIVLDNRNKSISCWKMFAGHCGKAFDTNIPPSSLLFFRQFHCSYVLCAFGVPLGEAIAPQLVPKVGTVATTISTNVWALTAEMEVSCRANFMGAWWSLKWILVRS